MNIMELCDKVEENLIVRYLCCQNIRWTVMFKDGAIEENGGFLYVHGEGHTPQEAIDDYCKQIAGQRIIIDALGKQPKRFTVPNNLTAT